MEKSSEKSTLKSQIEARLQDAKYFEKVLSIMAECASYRAHLLPGIQSHEKLASSKFRVVSGVATHLPRPSTVEKLTYGLSIFMLAITTCLLVVSALFLSHVVGHGFIENTAGANASVIVRIQEFLALVWSIPSEFFSHRSMGFAIRQIILAATFAMLCTMSGLWVIARKSSVLGSPSRDLVYYEAIGHSIICAIAFILVATVVAIFAAIFPETFRSMGSWRFTDSIIMLAPCVGACIWAFVRTREMLPRVEAQCIRNLTMTMLCFFSALFGVLSLAPDGFDFPTIQLIPTSACSSDNRNVCLVRIQASRMTHGIDLPQSFRFGFVGVEGELVASIEPVSAHADLAPLVEDDAPKVKLVATNCTIKEPSDFKLDDHPLRIDGNIILVRHSSGYQSEYWMTKEMRGAGILYAWVRNACKPPQPASRS